MKNSDDFTVPITIDCRPYRAIKPNPFECNYLVPRPSPDAPIVLGSMLVDENKRARRVIEIEARIDGRVALHVEPAPNADAEPTPKPPTPNP